jgi:hypothetical protein
VARSSTERGFFLWLLEGMDERQRRCQRKGAAMKTGVSCVALGFGLFTATIIALAQTTSPTVVAQGPSSAPSSGVLATPPAAPVLVPPSGVLATPPGAPLPVTPPSVQAPVERHRISNARPFKTAQNAHHLRSRPDAMRRYVVHFETPPRRDKSTRPTILPQNIAPTSVVDRPPAEEGRSFLSQFGKAKEPAQ